MAIWRVMGSWPTGREFLVVMGSSEADVVSRVLYGLEDYTMSELRRCSFWSERWESRTCRWVYVQRVRLHANIRKLTK